MIAFGASLADCMTVNGVRRRSRSVLAFVRHSTLHNPLDELGGPAPSQSVIEQANAGHTQRVKTKAGGRDAHAATSSEGADTPAR